MTQREQFVATTSRLLAEDPSVVLLLGDISVHAFRHAMTLFPARVLNCGCAEQATVGFAAGLALQGYYPILHSIDPFFSRRAYEQILLDLGHQKLGALFVVVGRDRAYARMGPSHWDDDCGTLMRTVPRMHVVEPGSSWEVELVMASAARDRRLAYVRL